MSNNPYVKIKSMDKKIKIIVAAVLVDVAVTAVMAVGVYLTL